MYGKNIYRFINAVEVREFHSAKYGAPGMGRVKKQKPTPEQMEKINQSNRERKARHKLRTYFDIHDYFVDLTYRKDARPPDMRTAKKHFSHFIRRVRAEYRKRGEPLFWMRNVEVGTKGAWHIHLIINRIPDTDIILDEAWEHGIVQYESMKKKGEFRQLASYITKTPRTEPRLKEADYSCSRNMPLPPPEKKVISRWAVWKEIKIPKGFYLDKDSIHEGINPVTGYPYREYTFLRIDHIPIERRTARKQKKKRRRRESG